MRVETHIRTEHITPYIFQTFETENGFTLEIREELSNFVRYRESMSSYKNILELEDTLKTILEANKSLSSVYNVDNNE